MKEDPEYLRNQSRYLHASYRRNWWFVRIFLLLWSAFFVGQSIVATIDVLAEMGWGFNISDIWNSLLFLLGGGGLWLFFRLIQSLAQTHMRRIYGPEPAEEAK